MPEDVKKTQMLQNGSIRKIKSNDNEVDSSSQTTSTATTTTMTYLKSFYKVVNICIILSLSIVICFLIFTFLTESESSGHNNGHDNNNLSFLETKWERTKRRTNSIYLASTIPLSTLEQQPQEQKHPLPVKEKKDKNEKVELGKKLLRNGDSLGAETICKSEINAGNLKHSDYVNALVCLGEARLALHNAAWNMGLLESEHLLIYDRLHLAKNDFEIAVSIEPTDLGARLGLGLAYFLIATREQSESSSQFLFNSILHFEAISVLVDTKKEESEDHDGVEGESISNEEIENIRISAMYNNALAHLALDDIKEATSILTKVSNLMDIDGDNQSMKGISSIKTNLGAAVLQRGTSSEQAIQKMNRSEVMKYCRRQRFENDEMDNKLSSAKQSYLDKQCSILLNNISIAQEKASDSLTQDDTNDFDSKHDHTALMNLSLLYEGKLGLQSASFSSMNSAEKMENVPRLTMQSDNENGSHDIADKVSQVDAAEYNSNSNDNKSNILDEAVSLGVNVAQESNMATHQWTLLSRTKLTDDDDVEGAIDATTKCLRVARGFDEVKACKVALEEVLDHISHTTKESRLENFQKETLQSSSVDNDVQILRLEKEILSLKMQILQQSMNLGETLISREHDTQHDNDKTSQSENLNEETQNLIEDRHKKNKSIQILQEKDDIEINEEMVTALKQSSDNASNKEIFKESSLNGDKLDPKQIVNKVEVEEAGSVNEIVNQTIELYENDSNTKLEVQSVQKEQTEALPMTETDVSNENELSAGEVIVETGDTADEISEDRLDNVPSADLVKNGKTGKDVQNSNMKNSDVVSDNIQYVANKSSIDEVSNQTEGSNDRVKKEVEEEEEKLILPELYKPVIKVTEPVDASSLGYMKVADAYMKKENYLLASKQFQKVIKKSPSHIPANIGYATSMERYVKPKQLGDVARAYANVTVYAMEQNNFKLAEATFRRSLKVSKLIDGDRLESIKFLSTICFNHDLAAEIYYELGLEQMKSDSLIPESLESFKISNAFASAIESSFASKALFQIAKITFDIEHNPKKALKLINSVLTQSLSELEVDAHVLSGQIKEKLLNVSGAIEDYKKAITYPETNSMAHAYYNLGMAMKSEGGDVQTIQSHIKKALDLGIDLTAEAIEILGDHDISVIKSAHRAEWKKYQEGMKDENKSRGGIINGSVVSSKSIFSSKDSTKGDSEESLDTLSILEQGAASYDGSSIPSGDEAIKSDTPSNLSNQKRSSSAKVNKEKTLNI